MTDNPETKDLISAVERYADLHEAAYKAYYTSRNDLDIKRACRRVIKQGEKICALTDAITAMMLDDLDLEEQQ